MEQTQNKETKNRNYLILLLLLLLIFIVFFVIFFLKDKKNDNESTSSDITSITSQLSEVSEKEYINDEEVFNDFFAAKTIHVQGEIVTTYADGSSGGSQSIEIWKDENNLRIDYDISGSHARTLIVKDDTATFYYHGSRTTSVAVLPAEFYLEMFNNKDFSSFENLGIDDTFSGTKYYELIEKVFDMEGATNPYYIKSLTYCVGKTGVIYVESTENYLENGEPPTSFDTSKYVYNSYHFNVTIEEGIFADPY